MTDTTTDTPRAIISILEHGVNGAIALRARYGADTDAVAPTPKDAPR